MNKLSIRFLIVILTFVLGLLAVAGWLCYREATEVKIIIPDARRDSIFFNGVSAEGGINQVTKLGGLTELRKTSLKKGDIEIRVWRGFGLSPLEGIALKRIDGLWSAVHLKANNYHEAEKVEVKELNAPKSGWESFWQQLANKEILTLPQSTEEECNTYPIDGIGYLVEINKDRIYRTYSYPEGNGGKCREAKQTEEMGEFIGLEFDSGTEKCKTTEWFACMTFLKTLNQSNQ